MKSIKDLLDTRTVSLQKVADGASVNRQTLYNIIYGTRKPSYLTVKKICSYFGADYKEYIE